MFEVTCNKCGVVNKEDGSSGCSCCQPIMAVHALSKICEIAPLIACILAIRMFCKNEDSG